jgi:exoribonuclease R
MRLLSTNYKTFTVQPEGMPEVPEIHFEGHQAANHCLPGDTVNWTGTKCELVKRAPHRFIPGVLELNSKYVYGHTTRGAKIYLFHPHDRKYPPFRVGSNYRGSSRNQLGLIEWMDWEDFETMPRGNLIRLLGPCGDLEAERKALIYQYGSPQLAFQLFDIDDPDLSMRTQLEGFTFNIDPDGCLDIDDVLTLKQRSATEWDFIITISDVAAHIPADSVGDLHARHLGQTLYQNGEAVVPMLPRALSEMALSLRPKEKHVGLSLFCTWNTDTKSLSVDTFKETLFTNNRSYTYDSIYRADEFPLQILKDVASFLKGTETHDSHEWVAEAMLLYNKQVAQKLLMYGVGLLRTHKPADAQKLQLFTTLHPTLIALAYEAAKYEPAGPNKLHASLGSVPYCHASSPIRRYADLVNQRCLKAVLKNYPPPPTDPSIATLLNQYQKQAKRYERSLFFLEQIAVAPSGRVEGLVLSCTQEKTKVYIPSWKQTIRADPGCFTIGDPVTLDYYADLQKPYWDQRMVFRVSNSGNGNESPAESSTEER